MLSFTTAEAVAGFSVSVNTNGTYTGTFTETIPPAFPTAIAGPFVSAGSTGFVGSWAGSSSSPQIGGTFTIGTIQIIWESSSEY